MATGSSHFAREQAILQDLVGSFPDFTGRSLSWLHNPNDPPDFIAESPSGTVGLELREWLDGSQVSAAQGRDRQRQHLMDVIGSGWEQEHLPKNVALASVEPWWGVKIATADEANLRSEFYKCAGTVDETWFTNPERVVGVLYQTEFPGFPTMQAYFQAVRYVSGPPHGFCWIQAEEDGGAYDPSISINALQEALEDKLDKFAKPEWGARLAKHGLAEHQLLIHSGWNAYRSNTPRHPLTLEQIASRGAEFYAAHPQRFLFDRVWLFDSLDSADEINALVGLPVGTGRVRWLAQLWPSLVVTKGSKS
jgi:hypothetical protein